MRHLIVLSGDLIESPLTDRLLEKRDHVVAADGGTDHLRRMGVTPDLVVGDFDSISPEGQAWILERQIKVLRFPQAKNATDSEIALEASLAALPPSISLPEVELVFLGALGNRPDHVLGNQLMAAALARKGYRVTMSDGVSILYAVHGPDRWEMDLGNLPATRWAISVISVSTEARGISYQGLRYPLDDFDLQFGSSRGISNEPEKPNGIISIELASGTILICLTPAG